MPSTPRGSHSGGWPHPAGVGYLNEFGEKETGLLKVLGLKSASSVRKDLYCIRPMLELPVVKPIDFINMDQKNERGIKSPLDLLREIEATDTAEAHRFVETMRVFRPRLVVNTVRTAEDVKLGFAVASVCKKYFGIEVEYLGYVNYDDEARRSVSLRRPIVDLRSDADVSIYLQRIARKLLEPASAPAAQPPAERARVGQATPQSPVGTAPGFSRG